MHISRMDLSWIRDAFIHCVTAALSDIALEDL
jgi:hypothetical protein